MDLKQILFSSILAFIGYFVVTNTRRYLKTRYAYLKVKGPKGHWLLGHLAEYSPCEKDILAHAKRMLQFPKVQSMWLGTIGFISAYYPSLCSTILSNEEPKYRLQHQFMKPWLGDGLLLSVGKKWKRNRKLLTPAFHFEILKSYVSVLNDTASELVENWKKGDETIEISKPVNLMTFDSILQCTMSYKCNCQKTGLSHPYVNAIYDLTYVITQRFYQPLYNNDFLFSLTPMGRRFKRALKIAHEHSAKIIETRAKEIKSEDDANKRRYRDFLDILLLARDADGNGLTVHEIREQVDTFMFAGSDSTASTISWCLYNLAKFPLEQEKCRKEVLKVIVFRSNVTWEDLNKLSFLTMFIKESMRFNPPVPLIARQVTKPITFTKDLGKDQLKTTTSEAPDTGQTFPTNSLFQVNVYNLHNNPYLWEEPEKFNPLRFSPENVEKRSPYSFIPFSAGPRNCIGQNFAMMEVKITLALLLKNFKICLDKNHPKPEMIAQITLKSANGIYLKLEAFKRQ